MDYQIVNSDATSGYMKSFGRKLFSDAHKPKGLESVVAFEGLKPVAILTFETRRKQCFIYDFFVLEEWRHDWVAHTMYIMLIYQLHKEGRIHEILFILPHEEEKLEGFLQSLGMKLDESAGYNATFTLEEVLRSDLLKKESSSEEDVEVCLLDDFRSRSDVSGFEAVVSRTPWALKADDYYRKFSNTYSVVLVVNGVAKGFMMMEPVSEKTEYISFLYIVPKYRSELVPLLRAAAQLLSQEGEGLVFETYLSTGKMVAFIQHFFPNAKLKKAIRYHMYF